MRSLRSAAVLYTNYGTGGAFELPTQSGTYTSAPQQSSLTYKSFIRPILEYATPVWYPFQQAQIYQIERIQCNMARFVMNDYSRYSSVTSMLNYLSWPHISKQTNL